MVRKGKLEVIKPFWEKYSSEFDAAVLGLAAREGQEEVLRWMLEDVKLDPTVPIEGKRAYDLASTKGTRNVFRKVAFNHPDLWDWTAAHVPSGLSEEQEAEQEKKKAERRKGLKDKAKEREKDKASKVVEVEKEPEVVPVRQGPSVGPQKLGGRPGGEGSLAGLSTDMRATIERERRARAAEARFK
jgi:hypothetical protein